MNALQVARKLVCILDLCGYSLHRLQCMIIVEASKPCIGDSAGDHVNAAFIEAGTLYEFIGSLFQGLLRKQPETNSFIFILTKFW